MEGICEVNMATKTKREWIEEGENYRKNRNYRKAVKCFDNALNIDPNDWEIWHLKGLSFYYLNG